MIEKNTGDRVRLDKAIVVNGSIIHVITTSSPLATMNSIVSHSSCNDLSPANVSWAKMYCQLFVGRIVHPRSPTAVQLVMHMRAALGNKPSLPDSELYHGPGFRQMVFQAVPPGAIVLSNDSFHTKGGWGRTKSAPRACGVGRPNYLGAS